jgi:hypothetical protein
LRAITDVPSGLQEAFYEVFSPIFTHFNAMQSQLLDKILRDEQSLVVAAPTGKSERKKCINLKSSISGAWSGSVYYLSKARVLL